MGWATRRAVIVFTLAVVALACGDTSDERGAFLEGARRDLLDAVDLQPLANEDQVDLGSIKSKTAPRYLTATGRLPGSVEEVTNSISEAVQRSDFTNVEPYQPRPGTVAAVRDEVVATFSVYEQIGVLPVEPGMTYVQLQLGERDPALAWTQVR